MSVLINARGTNHGSFRVGAAGMQLGEAGSITPPADSDLRVNLTAGRSLVVNSDTGASTIRSGTATLRILSNQLQLNATTWPAVDGAPGQVLQTNGNGTLYWATVTGGGGTPSFDTQLANTVFAAPNGVNGYPAFRKIVPADIPVLNQDTTGNAATATRLASGRAIGIRGDATWNVTFDGSAPVTSNLVLADTGVIPGIYTRITVDSKGRIVAGESPTTLGGYGITDAVTLDTVQSVTASKAFLSNLYVGNADLGQAGAPTLVAYANEQRPAVAVVPKDTALSKTGSIAHYGTFGSGTDTAPKRVADVWAGFDGGEWGTEYIAWGVGVGVGGSNEGGIRTEERMRLYNTGLVCNGDISLTSDERLKTDWRTLDKNIVTALTTVKSGTYRRTDTGAIQVGVSAQYLRNILPEAVHEAGDGELSVSYGNAALALCVELAKRIVELEERINALTK